MEGTVPIDQIIKYENGDMDFAEVIKLFQTLVDTGVAWRLQGHYGRTASDLIERGYVTPPKDDHDDA